MIQSTYQSILLVRLRAVGEVVMTLPVVDVVRRNFPNAYLAMLVESPCEQVFEADERVDRVFVFDKARLRTLPYHQRVRSFWEFIGSMREHRFDLAIDLHNVSRSQWLTFLSGTRERVGLYTRSMTRYLHTRILEVPKDARQHNITRYIQILKHMGLDVDDCTYDMRISSDALSWADQWFRDNIRPSARRVVIHPGAAHLHKCWPAERFARLGDLLCERHDAEIVISCGPNERALGLEVKNAMKRDAKLLQEIDLQKLGALLSKCDLTVSNDTGPTHISSAVGTPTIAVIGPTNPYISGPATTCSAIVWAERYCSPCYKHMFTCPLRKCFSMVSPEMVLEQAAEMLEQGRPTEHRSAVPGIHPRGDLREREAWPHWTGT